MFARVGYVSFDLKGSVVGIHPADCLADPGRGQPQLVSGVQDQPAESPVKLSCHIGAIHVHPKGENSSESYEMIVTLKNAGMEPFELKHDAASDFRRLLLVEIHDATGTMLFRMDQMVYHSQNSFDPKDWPVLLVGPGGTKATEFHCFAPESHGLFPPGKYSLRVYFPFAKGKYYSSNPVSFEIKEGDRRKGLKP